MAEPKKALQLFAALPIALLVIGSYYVWDRGYVSHPDGAILVVRPVDPEAPSAAAFSLDVWNGVQRAKDLFQRKYQKTISVEPVDVAPRPGANLSLMLSRAMSKYRILGVISAGTSQTDKPLAALCQHLHIPLLITVATTDRLTSHAGDAAIASRTETLQDRQEQRLLRQELRGSTGTATSISDPTGDGSTDGGIQEASSNFLPDSRPPDFEERTVFRMLPNNNQQATSIADFIKAPQSHATGKIIIFYENNDYAQYLFNNIDRQLRQYTRFQYRVEDSASIMQAMPSVERLKADATLIYLGYADHATDLLQALAAYGITLPVILSDGCWSGRLLESAHQLHVNHLSIAFPTNPMSTGNQLHGFAVYGYEAFLLLATLGNKGMVDQGDRLIDVFNRNLDQVRTDLPQLEADPTSASITQIVTDRPSSNPGQEENEVSVFVSRFSPTGEPEEAPAKLIHFHLYDIPSPQCCPSEPKEQH